MIPQNTFVTVDSDIIELDIILKEKNSIVELRRITEKSDLNTSSAGYVDFKNNKIGLYQAYHKKDIRQILIEKSIPFKLDEGEFYQLESEMRNGCALSMTIKEEKNRFSIEASTYEADVGWGMREYEILEGDIEVIDYRNRSLQPTTPVLLAIGDSYIEGNSLFNNKEKRYIYQIKTALEGEVFICGQGGAQSTHGLQWIKEYLLEICNPQYLMIALGMNETDFEKWVYNMSQIIKLAEKEGIIPILETIPMVPKAEVRNDVHAKMNEWIYTSGYEYLDIAKELSVDKDGIMVDNC